MLLWSLASLNFLPHSFRVGRVDWYAQAPSQGLKSNNWGCSGVLLKSVLCWINLCYLACFNSYFFGTRGEMWNHKVTSTQCQKSRDTLLWVELGEFLLCKMNWLHYVEFYLQNFCFLAILISSVFCKLSVGWIMLLC